MGTKTTRTTHVVRARAAATWGAWVLAVACSGGEAPPSAVEVRPEPSAATPPSTPTPVETETPVVTPTPAPTEVSPTPVGPRDVLSEEALDDVDVYALDVDDVSLASVETVRVHHPDPIVSERLATYIEEGSTAFALEEQRRRANDADDEGVEIGCRAIAATRALVSVECRARWSPDYRGALIHEDVRFLQFEVVGNEVRSIETASAFVENASLEPEIEAAKQIALQDVDELASEAIGVEGWDILAMGLGDEGLRVVWVNNELILEEDVLYDDIIDRVRADGPVARMLGIGAFASGAAPPPIAGPEPTTGPWQIAPAMPFPEAMWRWASLPPELRASVRVVPGAVSAHLVVDAEADLEAARRVAQALGGARLEARTDTAAAIAPSLRQTHAGVNLREQPRVSAGWVATLPRGTVVVAGAPSSDPSWVAVVAATGLEGLVPARSLDEAACAPDASAAIAALPDDLRVDAGRATLRVRADAMQNGHLGAAVAFVSPSDARSVVSLRALDAASCTVGAELGRWTLDGAVSDALITRTAQTAGETLVLAQLGTSWVALRPGTDAPVWRRDGLAEPAAPDDVVAPALRGPSGRGFWPLAITVRGQPILPLRWDAATSTLVEDAPVAE